MARLQNSAIGEYHTVAHAPLGPYGALCGRKMVSEVARDANGKFNRNLVTCKTCEMKLTVRYGKRK